MLEGYKPQFAKASRPRRRSVMYALLLFVLGVCVLTWGTAYKTSLYHPPIADRAPAKLCTRASDASRASVERAVDSLALALALCWMSQTALWPRPSRVSLFPRRLARTPRALSLSPPRTLQAFYRPPPAAILR